MTTVAAPQTTTLSLDQIEPMQDLWPRVSGDGGSQSNERADEFAEILKAAEGVDPFPPIVVVAGGPDGRYLLADGWHRFAARRRLGGAYATVAAEVHHPGNGQTPEALTYELALRHTIGPTPLTGVETRVAVKRLISDHPDWSDRFIARKIGRSHQTVGRIRRGPLDRDTGEPGSPTEQDQRSTSEPSVQQLAKRTLTEFDRLLDRSRRAGMGRRNPVRAARGAAELLVDRDGDEALTTVDELEAFTSALREAVDARLAVLNADDVEIDEDEADDKGEE